MLLLYYVAQALNSPSHLSLTSQCFSTEVKEKWLGKDIGSDCSTAPWTFKAQ